MHLPQADDRSNPPSMTEDYAGMTFCPGIDRIPVARFLPPSHDILCNFMDKKFSHAGPVSVTQLVMLCIA